jgi:LAS superfamily LD-carboxypeptidase LdcB
VFGLAIAAAGCVIAAAMVFQKKEVSPDLSAVPPPVEPVGGLTGMTLLAGPLAVGDSVRFLVDGVFLATPDTAAIEISTFLAGHRAFVASERFIGAQRWIQLVGGWVPAPFVDQFPEPVDETLEQGGEGLASGRTLPWDYSPADLVTVSGTLVTRGAGERTVRLRMGAFEAFQRMQEAADRAGFDIKLLSGFRSASYQRGLYSRQLTTKGPFQSVSAPPGRSEHQLGTTADITVGSLTPLRTGFGDTPEGRWIAANSEEFGLVLSFSMERHEARQVSYEPWHLRWVGQNIRNESEW